MVSIRLGGIYAWVEFDFQNLWEIIKNIPKVNLYACGISVFCVVFLLLGKVDFFDFLELLIIQLF